MACRGARAGAPGLSGRAGRGLHPGPRARIPTTYSAARTAPRLRDRVGSRGTVMPVRGPVPGRGTPRAPGPRSRPMTGLPHCSPPRPVLRDQMGLIRASPPGPPHESSGACAWSRGPLFARRGRPRKFAGSGWPPPPESRPKPPPRPWVWPREALAEKVSPPRSPLDLARRSPVKEVSPRRSPLDLARRSPVKEVSPRRSPLDPARRSATNGRLSSWGSSAEDGRFE